MMRRSSAERLSTRQNSYRDFLPWSLLASLDQSPHHNRQAWEARIREPVSVTWIISDTHNDVGVLRITAGASSIPGTDSQLTTLYLLRHARGYGLGSEALAFARAEAARRGAPALGVCVLAGLGAFLKANIAAHSRLLTDAFSGYRGRGADLGGHLKHTPVVQGEGANAGGCFRSSIPCSATSKPCSSARITASAPSTCRATCGNGPTASIAATSPTAWTAI